MAASPTSVLPFCALLAPLVLLGCSSEDGSDIRATSAVPVGSCALPTLCDVTTIACVNSWADVVSCLRGHEVEAVPVTRITEGEFRRRFLVAEPNEEAEDWYWAYEAADLANEVDFDREVDAAAAFPGAIYDPEVGAILFIDRGQSTDDAVNNAVLLHELVHAAQDQQWGLAQLYEDIATSDEAAALQSAIEGEAEVYELLVLTALNGLDRRDIEPRSMFQMRQLANLESAFASDVPLWTWLRSFPYASGGLLAWDEYEAGGFARLNELLGDPPRSTRQVLLGRAESTSDTAPEFTSIASTNDIDAEGVGADSFGALGLVLHAGPAQSDDVLAQLDGFVGDRFEVLTISGPPLLIWQMRFVDDAAADAYLSLLPRARRSQWYFRSEAERWFVASPVDAWVERVLDAYELASD